MRTLRLFAAFFLTAVLIAACSAAVDTPAASREPSPPAALPDQPVVSNPDQPVQSEPGSVEPGQGGPVKPVDFSPQPGDSKLSRGNVYLESMDLLMMESFPPQFLISIEGSLPNPCYALRAVVTPPDADNKIAVDVYSVYDPAAICAEVIVPFAQGIPLGQLAPGKYAVFVNQQKIGDLEMPQS
jgi:hypothetical protein